MNRSCREFRSLPRRDFLRAGALPLMGLGLADLLHSRAQGGAAGKRAKSVLFVFLSGGLAHQDTFDMKPDAPLEARGEFAPISTNVWGIQICEHLPRLARQMDKIALLRSLTHHSSNHEVGTYMVLTGNNDTPPGFKPRQPSGVDWPSIATVAGMHAAGGSPDMPRSLILPQLIIHQTARIMRPGQLAGMLGPVNDPWVVNAAAFCTGFGNCPDCFHYQGKQFGHEREPLWEKPRNLRIHERLTRSRFDERMTLLRQIDGQQRWLEKTAATAAVHNQQQRAAAILAAGKAHRAFDMDREPNWLRDAYGRHLFGRSLLMARRLIEAGVGLVQVNLGNLETWDTHWNNFQHLKHDLLPPFDQAVSALLADMESRGLLEETLIVILGEFGRSPKINKNAGREHWGRVNTALFAGGGVRGGQAIGRSDSNAANIEHDPYHPADVGATIYQALGINPRMTIHDQNNHPFTLNEGHAIADLFS